MEIGFVGTDRKEGITYTVCFQDCGPIFPPQAFAVLFIAFLLSTMEIQIRSQEIACLLGLEDVKAPSGFWENLSLQMPSKG